MTRQNSSSLVNMSKPYAGWGWLLVISIQTKQTHAVATYSAPQPQHPVHITVVNTNALPFA
jgi:hypothetical protein